MTRYDTKLARIAAGQYQSGDFILADAKDGDMGPALPSTGPVRAIDGSVTRFRTRREFLDQIKAILKQDVVDIMLTSASNLEVLRAENTFDQTSVKAAIRANDASDIWVGRGATYAQQPSRGFRTASIERTIRHTDLGLYSITFNNHLDADHASLEAFHAFRREAEAEGFSYFLEVFNPNAATGLAPDLMPQFVNDCIVRMLAGLTKAERPRFLKIAFNGPAALEELASWDPTLIVGVLGGGAGTARDTFELLAQAEKHGARVALFGRKINLAEDPLALLVQMRAIVDGQTTPQEAVRAYHGDLQKNGIRPVRPLDDDLVITEAVLKHAGS
jgi:hypothetical protein